MPTLGEILVRLGVDNTGLSTGLAKSKAELGGFGGALDEVGLKAKSTSGIAGQLGGSIGGLISPTTIAAGGALALAGAIGESIKAAMDDQSSIALLTASLKANVPGWTGTTAAIEDYITSAEKASGFSRDELRTSLEALVGATHDVAKAEADQTTATNLARYKNIDLASATQLVVDVEAGRFRGLIQLGIATHKGETAQEALNAINEVAAGQDTSYLGTAAGQMDVLSNHIHDLEVELGNKLLPVFEQILSFINNNMIPAVGFAAGVWDNFLNVVTLGGSRALEAYNMYEEAQQAAQQAAAASAAASAAAYQGWSNQVTGDLDNVAAAGDAYWGHAQEVQDAALAAQATAQGQFNQTAAQKARDNADTLQGIHDQSAASDVAIEKTRGAAVLAAMNAAGQQADAVANKAGFDAAVAYGQGLHSGQSTVDTDLKQLTDDIKNTLSVPKQIAKLEGELTSKALAKALEDNRPQVKTDAIATVQAIMDQLSLLGVTAPKLSKPAAAALKDALAATKDPTLTAADGVTDAVKTALTQDWYSFGYKTAQTYASGMIDELNGLPAKVDTALQKTVKKVATASPPGPESPFHNIGKWGMRTGQEYVDKLALGLEPSGINKALGNLTSGFGGSGASAGMAGLSPAKAPQTMPPIQLVVDGRTLAEVNDRHTPALTGVYGSPALHNSSQR